MRQTRFRGKLSQLSGSPALFRLAQLVLGAVFLALTFTVSLAASEGPDEVAHFYFIRFVAQHGRLPLNKEERLEAGYKADLPPLFYIVAGLPMRGVDLEAPPQLKTSRNNPRLQLVMGHQNIKAWRMLKTEDPLRSEVLLWHWGRWFTMISGLAGLGLVYTLLRRTQPDQPWLALAGTVLLGFLPGYIYISGITSYEPLAGLLLTGYFILLYGVIRQPTRNLLYLGLGLLLGLAALTRHTPWPVIPAVPLLIVWLVYRQAGWNWRPICWRLALFGLGVAITFGSWIFYMSLYFNQVAELGWFQGLLSPFFIGDGSGKTSQQIASVITGGELGIDDLSRQSDSIWQWAWRFFNGIWGGRGIGGLLLLVWGAALIGLVRIWRRQSEQMRLWWIILLVHISLFLALPFLRFLFSGQAATAMSQHILFPAGAAMILLLIYGLSAWLSPRYLTGALFILAGVYLWFSLGATLTRSNERLPIRTVPIAAKEETLASFETVSLIGYERTAREDALKITLWWRAEALSAEDYWLELTLLDDQNQGRSRWIGQPLNGRYPTRAWSPNDRVRDVILLPVTGLLPGDYRLQVRLLDEFGLAVAADSGLIDLERFELNPSPALAADTLRVGDQWVHYRLWPDTRGDNSLPVYHEYATVTFAAQPAAPADSVRLGLRLVGPDDQDYKAMDQTGSIYSFNLQPGLPAGTYRLRIEQWKGDQLVAQADSEPLFEVATETRQFELDRPITQPLAADFAGYVALLGYDLPQRRVQPGQEIPVTLHWQALRTIGADLIMFNRLIGKGEKVWGGRDRVAREAYSTMLWAPQEIVADSFTVQIEAGAPDGLYNIFVGLYLPVGESSISLPLRQNGRLSDVTNVRLGPILIGETPAQFVLDRAEPQVMTNRLLGSQEELKLIGFDLIDRNDQSAAKLQSPISDLHLRLYWQSIKALDRDYTIFVHIRNDAGETVAQQDQPPLGGTYPTGLWLPGELIGDDVVIGLPPELPNGNYSVVFGMYDVHTGERLAIAGDAHNEVILAKFKVDEGRYEVSQ